MRALALLILCAAGAHAAKYYVSYALGDDTRTSVQAQSPTAPWQHHPDSQNATSNAQAIRTTLAADDQIIMRMGETWWNEHLVTQKAGTSGHPIVTTTEVGFGAGAQPILSGAVLLSGAWTNTGVNGEYSVALATQPLAAFSGDTELTSGTPGALGSNGFGWAANVLYAKIGGDPTGGNIQAAQTYALRVAHSYRKYASLDLRYSNDTTAGVAYLVSVTGVQVTGCTISRARSYGIRVFGSTDFEIDNNIVTARPNDTDTTQSTATIYVSNSNTRGLIHDNTATNSAQGISLASGITGVSVYSNNLRGVTTGVTLNTATANAIYGNDFAIWNGIEYGAGGKGKGMDVIGGAADNTIRDNLFHDGYVDLLLGETSGTAANVVAFNVFRRPHVNSIYVGTGGTASAADLVYDNIIIQQPTATAGAGTVGHGLVFLATAVHGYECKYGNVQHNIFIGEANGPEMVSVDTGIAIYPASMSQIVLDYNYYIQKNAGDGWRLFDNSGNDTMRFATWTASLVAAGVTGAEAHGSVVAYGGSSALSKMLNRRALILF